MRIKCREWIYTLKSGPAIRRAVEDGDLLETLNALKDGYDELLYRGTVDDDECDDLLDDIDYLIDDIQEDPQGDYEDDVDYQLSEFYDLCDNIGVWIPLE